MKGVFNCASSRELQAMPRSRWWVSALVVGAVGLMAVSPGLSIVTHQVDDLPARLAAVAELAGGRLYLPLVSTAPAHSGGPYQLGGLAADVAIDGDFAYLGAGERLLALD